MNRKGGTGGDGWVYPKGMAASGLSREYIAFGWSQVGHFSGFKCIMGLENSVLTLYSLTFQFSNLIFLLERVTIARAS